MNMQSTQVEGIVNRIIFSKPEEFFHIFTITTEKREILTVKGSVQMINLGDKMVVSGEQEDTKFGKQIKALVIENTTCSLNPGDTGSQSGVTAFLSSGIIKGIGKELAKRIVKHFGDETLSVIENTYGRLAEVKGVTAKKAKEIHVQAVEQIAIARLMSKLGKYGISAKMMSRVHIKFGEKAVEMIDENPYCLCQVEGIAFKMADRYAQAAGVSKECPLRLKEGVKYVLQEAVMIGGSCGLATIALTASSVKILEVSSSFVATAISASADSGDIVIEGEVCYDVNAWAAEESITKHLIKLISAKPSAIKDVKKVVLAAETSRKIELSQLQRDAVIRAIENRVSVITGQPGTGKTTIVQVLLESLMMLGELDEDILVAAPTGKAANRLNETCGKGSTQHRVLGSDGPGNFMRSSSNPLSCTTLIIDEFSMDDVFLANATFRALKKGARLVLVGDVDQLPSVGPGQVLKDIIDSGRVPVTKLTEIRRQGEGSSIVMAAAAINSGKIPVCDHDKKDFIMIKSANPQAMMLKSVARMLELGEVPDSIQVLCPMKGGDVGVRSMNVVLQPLLNPLAKEGAVFVERFETRYFIGDRVMQLINDYDYDVFNGDIGKVVKVDGGTVVVAFNSATVDYTGTMLDSLTLSYACTVHKFQGSEAKNVIMPISMAHFMMLKRNLVYTGVTRARNRMILVIEPHQRGDMVALQNAVEKTDDSRISRLKSLLQAKLAA